MSQNQIEVSKQNSANQSKILNTENSQYLSSHAFKAYFRPSSTANTSGGVGIPSVVGNQEKQFSRVLSDPKLIVARHVFSDSHEFCKKTLDLSE